MVSRSHRSHARVASLSPLLGKRPCARSRRRASVPHRSALRRIHREGLDPAAARAEAERRFGDAGRFRDQCVEIDSQWSRERNMMDLLHTVAADLRYAARQLGRTPSLTIAAILCFALGIGANTSIFSVVDAVLFRPLPFPDPIDSCSSARSCHIRRREHRSDIGAQSSWTINARRKRVCIIGHLRELVVRVGRRGRARAYRWV